MTRQAPAALAPAPTAAAAIAQVATWDDLSDTRRRDLVSYLSGAARMAGLPSDALTLSPGELRARVLDRSAAGHGLSRASMSNVFSGLRYVLRRLGVIEPEGGALDPAWERQLALLPRLRRTGVTGFGRFCSARGIAPGAVTLQDLEEFEAHLAARTLHGRPSMAAYIVRGEWNRACTQFPEWVGEPIAPRGRRNRYGLPLTAFPEGFQADLAALGQRLSASSLDPFAEPDGTTGVDTPLLSRPLRASTVAMRLEHARWAASALVATGIPIEALTSLRDLVVPTERARTAIRFFFDRAGGRPSTTGSHVAEVLRIVARHYHLPPDQQKRIGHWSRPVAVRYRGITEHNRRRVGEAMQPEFLERLLVLPEVLMSAADRLHPTAPDQARVLALRAVAVGILIKLPLRVSNLIGLRLDEHLHRPDPRRGRIAGLTIPAEDTKNHRAITLPVPSDVAALIERWLARHRRAPAPGCPFLFPGLEAGRSITPQGMRHAVKQATRQHVGVELSPHQFRHLLAHLFLRSFPGHHDEVRQLLGHASVSTTVKHYSGDQVDACARRYDQDVLGARRAGRGGR